MKNRLPRRTHKLLPRVESELVSTHWRIKFKKNTSSIELGGADNSLAEDQSKETTRNIEARGAAKAIVEDKPKGSIASIKTDGDDNATAKDAMAGNSCTENNVPPNAIRGNNNTETSTIKRPWLTTIAEHWKRPKDHRIGGIRFIL